MSKKKSAVKNLEAPEPEEPQSQETPTDVQPEPEPEAPEPQPEQEVPQPQPEEPVTPTLPPTLESLFEELQALEKLVEEHTAQITQLQETLARKRKPVASNGKVQILDKQTGTIYPSKNNCYKSLLKSGELKDLVAQGIFGDVPEKNTFGAYALFRALPARFEEVVPEQAEADGKS